MRSELNENTRFMFTNEIIQDLKGASLISAKFKMNPFLLTLFVMWM
jgi:hypothetical protein